MKLLVPLLRDITLASNSGTLPSAPNDADIDKYKAGTWTRKTGTASQAAYMGTPDALNPRTIAIATASGAQAQVAINALPAPLQLLASSQNGCELYIYRQTSAGLYALISTLTVSNTYALQIHNYNYTRYLIRLVSGQLDDLQAWSIIDIDNYIDDFASYQATHEVSIYTPVSHHPLALSKSPAPTAVRLMLTIPRAQLDILQSLEQAIASREVELVETISGTDYHYPATIETHNITPSGTLISIEMRLRTIARYPRNPQRRITASTTNSLLLWDATRAPAPCEIRLWITAISATDTVLVRLMPSDQTIRFVPNEPGIYSLYDNGRLYYTTTTPPSDIIDRTDILQAESIPPLLMPNDNTILVDPAAHVISQIACAYYPRTSGLEFA